MPEEDRDAARILVRTAPFGELFLCPGDRLRFAEASVAGDPPDAAAQRA